MYKVLLEIYIETAIRLNNNNYKESVECTSKTDSDGLYAELNLNLDYIVARYKFDDINIKSNFAHPFVCRVINNVLTVK